MKIAGVHDDRNLDPSGEAEKAELRMEARAVEPASERMFEALVAPLLETHGPRRILELGCGSGALSRRVSLRLPKSRILATDKSEAMLAFARAQAVRAEASSHLVFEARDVTSALTFEGGSFDLILPFGDGALPFG